MSGENTFHLRGKCPHCKNDSPCHERYCPLALAAMGRQITFKVCGECGMHGGDHQLWCPLAEANRALGVPYHELICGHPEPEKKQGPKLVYVAGPYRAETREGVAQNVAAARHVGQLCVRKGWFPVLPTINTAHFDHDFPGLADDQYWLDGTMELMRRCDAVVLVDGWQYSSGAKAEIEEARKLGLKVYLSTSVMPQLEKVTA